VPDAEDVNVVVAGLGHDMPIPDLSR